MRLICIVLALILWFTGSIQAASGSLKIVSYNVENLFHPKHDTIWKPNPNNVLRTAIGSPIEQSSSPIKGREYFIEKDDYEWTPEGERRWSYTRYYRKVENIAQVLTNIGEWNGVDIVGLQEVENALCVKRLCYTLRPGEYDFVHYESHDPRGIDVALIYKKDRVDTIATKKINPSPGCSTTVHRTLDRAKLFTHSREGELMTRDILYVEALIDKRDTLHLFVCHFPSQRGGAAESEWKREAAKKTLQRAIDSVYLAFRDPKIVVMGDFNEEAPSNSPLKGERKEFRGINYRKPINGKEIGTHKHQGLWTCLDQFYTSPGLDSVSSVTIYDAEWIQEPDEKFLGLKPKRTYNGFQYKQDGYSDHLPIVMELKIKN